MKNISQLKLMVIAVISVIPLLSSAATVDDFLDLSYTNPTSKIIMKYRLFIPKSYNKNIQYPLVGFLHGAGEGDFNNVKQVTANEGCLYWASDSIQKKYPSFVLGPNTAGNDGPWATCGWENGNFIQDNYPISEALQNYINIIKQLQAKYSIDLDRTYSTGLSMGGGGTWASITRFPDLFAAAIPLCGYGDPSKMPLIKHIPVWTFHGTEDGIITVEGTRALVNALKKAGGTVKYSELNVGHFVWGNAYNGERGSLADWLFAQKRKPTVTNVYSSKENINTNFEMNVYPNPCKGSFFIQGINTKSETIKIKLLTIDGQELKTIDYPNDSSPMMVTTEEIPAGLYLLKYNNKYQRICIQ